MEVKPLGTTGRGVVIGAPAKGPGWFDTTEKGDGVTGSGEMRRGGGSGISENGCEVRDGNALSSSGSENTGGGAGKELVAV